MSQNKSLVSFGRTGLSRSQIFEEIKNDNDKIVSQRVLIIQQGKIKRRHHFSAVMSFLLYCDPNIQLKNYSIFATQAQQCMGKNDRYLS